MNDNAKKWIAALLSNTFQQTRGTLHDTDGYCCLGVACEVAIDNGLQVEVHHNDISSQVSYDEQLEILPKAVQEWLGLKTDAGELYLDESHADCDCRVGIEYNTTLATLNDEGWDFKAIAKVIQTHADVLFEQQVNG